MKAENIIRGALLLALLLAVSQPATAQIEKDAQAGFRFLENPISAEAVGRGGVGTTMLRNSSAVFFNPAGMAWIEGKLDFGMHYTLGIAEIDQLSGVIAGRIGNLGVLGVSVTTMDYGDLYRTYVENNADGYVETGTFSPGAYAVGVAFSRAMSDRFSFGVHVKLARQDLGDAWIVPAGEAEAGLKNYSKSTPAIDVGALYDFQSHGLTFGAAIQNISQEVRYVDEQFPLPFAVRFSMTAAPLTFLDMDRSVHDFTVAVESWKGRDFGNHVQVGGEYHMMETLVARVGYMGNYSERGVTFGAGLRFSGLRFDYAFQEFGVFGNIHLISLGYGLGS